MLDKLNDITLLDLFALMTPYPPKEVLDLLYKIDRSITMNDRTCTRRDRETKDLVADWKYEQAQAMLDAKSRIEQRNNNYKPFV